MQLLNSTPRKTGILVSLIATILINSSQIIILLFNLPTPLSDKIDLINKMPSQGVDLLINVIYCFVLSWLVFEINYYLVDRIRNRFNLTIRIALSLLISAVLMYVFSHTYILHGSIAREFTWDIKMHFRGRGIMISFLMTGVVQLLFLYKKNQEQRMEVERLFAENIRSQYIALKNQVDPHFLFNSLNTLGGLISIDTTRAQEYLQRLSSIFRYSMQQRELVTVADELEFAKTFAELMGVRYGSALRINFDIPAEVMTRRIMPFALQLLIENAVKHNAISQQTPLKINLFMSDDRIVVENRINAKREREIGEGIGLVNLSKRYELFGNQTVTIKQENGVFSVSLPLIKEE